MTHPVLLTVVMNLFPSKKHLKCHTFKGSWAVILTVSSVRGGGQARSSVKHGFGISNIVWEGGKVITPSMSLCMETFSAARTPECALKETHRIVRLGD